MSTKDPSRSGLLSLTPSSITQRTTAINASGASNAVKVVVHIDLQRVGAGSSEFSSNVQAVVERSVLSIDSMCVVLAGQSVSSLIALQSWPGIKKAYHLENEKKAESGLYGLYAFDEAKKSSLNLNIKVLWCMTVIKKTRIHIRCSFALHQRKILLVLAD